MPTPPPIATASISPDQFSRDRLRPAGIFHRGGVIEEKPSSEPLAPTMKRRGEVLIRALKGEAVLTPEATTAIGGSPVVEAINAEPSMAHVFGAMLRRWVFRTPTESEAASAHVPEMMTASKTPESTVQTFHDGGVIDNRRPILMPGQRMRAIAMSASPARPAAPAPRLISRLAFNPAASGGRGSSTLLPKLPAMNVRQIQSIGAFAPPSVIQSPMMHGPQWMAPQSQMSSAMASQAVNVTHNHNHYWSAIDGPSVQRFVHSREFIYQFRSATKLNSHGLGSTLRYVTTGEP